MSGAVLEAAVSKSRHEGYGSLLRWWIVQKTSDDHVSHKNQAGPAICRGVEMYSLPRGPA